MQQTSVDTENRSLCFQSLWKLSIYSKHGLSSEPLLVESDPMVLETHKYYPKASLISEVWPVRVAGHEPGPVELFRNGSGRPRD